MAKVKTAISVVLKPTRLIKILGTKSFFNWLPDKPYLKLVYWGEINKCLNLDNPKTFNEKLQWLKLYDRRPEYSNYVDKYAVRSYINTTIGESYLIPILNVYEKVEEINWDSLPNKFVLKCTHGSGSNIICKNKNKLDVEESKKKLRKWMKKNWYWFGREWPYKNVKPRIICEQFIDTKDGKAPMDYKFLCFNGRAKLIQAHHDRFGKSYTNEFYDLNWEKTNISRDIPNSTLTIPKPKKLEEMIKMSEKLSRDIPFVRIDFYEENGQIYFGEITFYPASGLKTFKNINDDYKLGSWINLPIGN